MKPQFQRRAFSRTGLWYSFRRGHDLLYVDLVCRSSARGGVSGFLSDASSEVLAQTGHLDAFPRGRRLGGAEGARGAAAAGFAALARGDGLWPRPSFIHTSVTAVPVTLIKRLMPASAMAFLADWARLDVARGGVAWRRHSDRPAFWARRFCQQGAAAFALAGSPQALPFASTVLPSSR